MRDAIKVETVAQARRKANEYVRRLILQARRLECQGRHEDALQRLGLAIHTLQDSTSPEHQGFKPWDGKEHSAGALNHGLGENFDPNDGSALDAATKAAWDYFMGKQMPDNFFTFGYDSKPK